MDKRLRSQIATEAAKIMYWEDIDQYFDAKRIAARRVLGKLGAKRLRHQPANMPPNGEIKNEILEVARLAEGEKRLERLFKMRVVALESMKALSEFHPRLIGSVRSGSIRRGSDIDLHVFTDDLGALEARLRALEWECRIEQVLIQQNSTYREYTHFYIDRGFPLELSVYEMRERRITTRSSVTGKSIDRVSLERLQALIEEEHYLDWEEYLIRRSESPTYSITGELDLSFELEIPGEFDGLLAELNGVK